MSWPAGSVTRVAAGINLSSTPGSRVASHLMFSIAIT